MKQRDFENRYRAFWHNFVKLLEQLEGRQVKDEAFEQNWHEFPAHYRKICRHLSVAESRHYSPVLADYLHDMTLRGHKFLYRQKTSAWYRFFQLLAHDFPRMLRKDWRYWLVSSALFYLPLIFMGVMCFLDDQFIYSFVEYDQVKEYEAMYDPANRRPGAATERQSDSDFMMFGYYIMNNVGIDFRTYASGIFFGLGSIFFMVFNGLSIGSVAGHLSNVGFSETFWPFVAGHSALELTAATIAGGAGLKIGFSLINPGNYTRTLALKKAGIDTIPVITGAAVMTFLAAFVEGFWSATPWLSNEIKYTVGILSWMAVFAYLLGSGRDQ